MRFCTYGLNGGFLLCSFSLESRFRIIYFRRASVAERKRVSPGLGGVRGSYYEIEVRDRFGLVQRSRASSLRITEFLLVTSGETSRTIKLVPSLLGNYLI